jgi:hypothetical protein
VNEVLEITTFSLAPNVTAADFLAANTDINAYLKRQPGFLWRRVAQRDDETIVDIVAYASRADAESGSSGIVGEMADSPVHATIDHATVDWQLASTLQQVD